MVSLVRVVPGKRVGAGQTGSFLAASTCRISHTLFRLKVKRNLKRKERAEEKPAPKPKAIPARTPSAPSTSEIPRVPSHRPRKRARLDDSEAAPSVPSPSKTPQTSRPTQASSSAPRPNQIISSLFTYNPKIETPTQQVDSKPVAPSNAPLDYSTFSGLGLNPLLVSHLTTKMSILKPTAIQRASLPTMLSTAPEKIARDIFIQSQTGSGKTLSYLLPIIQDLLPLSSLSYIDRSIGTLAVIIAPTRELAKQISDVLEALLKMRLRPEDDSTS